MASITANTTATTNHINNHNVRIVDIDHVCGLTMFEKVREFNDAFGVDHVADGMDPNVTHNRPELVEQCLGLIREETRELEDAVEAHDFNEVRDALSDIMYVVLGMSYRLGIDADKDFTIVHNSNMTKLCDSEEEAAATVAEYERRRDEDGESKYDSPYYEQCYAVPGKWIVRNRSTRKVLKNVNYTPVKWPKIEDSTTQAKSSV